MSNRVNLIRFTQITFIEELYMQKHCQLELKKTEAIENEMKALNLQISTISRLRKLLSSKYILCVIKSKG